MNAYDDIQHLNDYGFWPDQQVPDWATNLASVLGGEPHQLIVLKAGLEQEVRRLRIKIQQTTMRDYQNVEGVGIRISADGNRVWLCVDGECVLRVKGIGEPVAIQDDRLGGDVVLYLLEACKIAIEEDPHQPIGDQRISPNNIKLIREAIRRVEPDYQADLG